MKKVKAYFRSIVFHLVIRGNYYCKDFYWYIFIIARWSEKRKFFLQCWITVKCWRFYLFSRTDIRSSLSFSFSSFALRSILSFANPLSFSSSIRFISRTKCSSLSFAFLSSSEMGVSTGGMLPPSRDCAVKLERLSAARKRAAMSKSNQVRIPFFF